MATIIPGDTAAPEPSNIERLIAEAHVCPLIGKIRQCRRGAGWNEGRIVTIDDARGWIRQHPKVGAFGIEPASAGFAVLDWDHETSSASPLLLIHYLPIIAVSTAHAPRNPWLTAFASFLFTVPFLPLR